MFKHLLIPTDGSALSLEAIQAGLRFAKEADARVTVVTVTSPSPQSPLSEYAYQTHGIYDAASAKIAEERLETATNLAKAAGVDCGTRGYQNWYPYQSIIQAAEDEHCDAIFMASHGRSGVSGVLLGSETQKVLTHCKLPVIVYRRPEGAPRLS